MSYCVNCGVKLKNSEKVCPLCNTEVINPKKEEYKPVYSGTIEEYKHINYKYVCKLITVVLLVMSLITMFCDLLISKKVTWSIYVLVSIIYLDSKLSFFLFTRKSIPLIVELFSSEILMFVIAYLNNGLHWFLYLVCPFIFIVWLYIVLCIFVFSNKKYDLLKRFAVSFAFISILLLTIESCIDLFKYEKIVFNWSIYAVLPITIISIIIFIISYNKKLIDEIKQRIFI